MAESDFFRSLQSLGLEQYHSILVNEAFDSWPILSRITEQDMNTLGIRLGHRRILQDAIARYSEANGVQQVQLQPTQVLEKTQHNHSALAPVYAEENGAAKSSHKQKRKYVRHPKTDENAPPRPLTGYVLFSNWIRASLRDKQHDFPDIARIVGKRWKAAPQAEKDHFLLEAKKQKDAYLLQMTQYRRTASYREYQRYLLDFKIRNGSLPPARAHGRLRNGEDSMDEEMGSPPSDAQSVIETNSMGSDYGSRRLPPFRPKENSSNDSEHSRSPPIVVRSPATIEPNITGLTYEIQARPGSGLRSPGIRSPLDSFTNRLPAINGMQTRQLPPLSIPALQS